MCLVGFAYKVWPGYPIVIASNRDEFFNRATEKASFWEDHPAILAGRDLQSFGTWLGVTKQGRVAFVTNNRNLRIPSISDPLSRGKLVSEFLISDLSSESYSKEIEANADKYEGFNLFVYDGGSLPVYISNRGGRRSVIEQGFHTLSNALWNTNWPKTEKLRSKMVPLYEDNFAARRNEGFPWEKIFEILNDRSMADSEGLPDTGIGKEKEKALSSIRITAPGYGTRASTIVAISEKGEVFFWEKTYKEPDAEEGEIVSYRFQIGE
ncbi:NRDE family protein [Leptospira idonii]|uniref:NRDE family protein n=1 Tax=Leptospira idonii TaxID=1193500 RepID=A0A4R9LZY7_9LEPT|nr:NRDE family protein [Leptospira idonii]TGN19953.1 NRDE family protein [Leptospira idonii]